MNTVVSTRRSGLTLVFLGLVGIAFFWLTDPHLGPTGHYVAEASRRIDWNHVLFVLRGSPNNAVDAANQARMGTILGILGSVGVLLVGLWLVSRRRA